jgi:hypothetical protein
MLIINAFPEGGSELRHAETFFRRHAITGKIHFAGKNDYFVDTTVHFVENMAFHAGNFGLIVVSLWLKISAMKEKYLLNRITGFAGKLMLCLLLSLVCREAAAQEEPIKSEYSYRHIRPPTDCRI